VVIVDQDDDLRREPRPLLWAGGRAARRTQPTRDASDPAVIGDLDLMFVGVTFVPSR
jgi:hypothetical protein